MKGKSKNVLSSYSFILNKMYFHAFSCDTNLFNIDFDFVLLIQFFFILFSISPSLLSTTWTATRTDGKSKFNKRESKKERSLSDKIFVNGYRFVIASQSPTTIYLKCANFRNGCKARASKRKNSEEVFVTKSEHNKNCTIGSGYFDDDVLVYGSDGAAYPYRTTNYGSGTGAGGDGEPSDNTVYQQQYGKYEKYEK